MSRRLVSAAAVIALVLCTAVPVRAQTGFGVRAASLSVTGDHVEMDPTTAFGAHVALGFVPFLKLQLGAEYLSGTATYGYTPAIPGSDIEADFTNIGVFLDVRKPFGLIPLFPIKLVLGGGLNYNLMSYVDEEMFNDPPVGGFSPEDFSHVGWHAMGGLLFDPPVLPFTITAEYRLQSIKLTDETVTSKGFVIGLTFGF